MDKKKAIEIIEQALKLLQEDVMLEKADLVQEKDQLETILLKVDDEKIKSEFDFLKEMVQTHEKQIRLIFHLFEDIHQKTKVENV